jgi:hypothetical protein
MCSMPQLSGPQLVERYLAKYPAPSVIYMTGYVDDETMQLELDEDVTMLRKPFSALELARTIRTTLDARRAPFQWHVAEHRMRRTVRKILVALVLVVLRAQFAFAQGGFLVQGVTDFEQWKTDSASTLLARGSGHPALLARADIWAAFEPVRNLVLFVEGLARRGKRVGKWAVT